MTKQSKTSARARKARSLHRRVRQIADELLTVNYGHPSAETGDRLAIKKQYSDAERDLGGRCRRSIEAVLLRHLSNDQAHLQVNKRKL
jgi:hypothetical protein